MRLGTINGPRLLAGMALFLGLLAATTIAGAAQEVGTVTIYKTACPAGYSGDDFYNDCYGNSVDGQPFSAEQGKSGETPAVVTTGPSGFATLPLYGGVTIIREGLPQGIADYFVYCTGEDGAVVEFEYTGDTFGILLDQEGGDYATGEELRCDWYNVPAADGGDGEAGTVTIYRTSCPAGYAGDDYYGDCADNPQVGVHFIIREAGTDVAAGFSTGPDGYTSTGLPLSAPGTVVIVEAPAGGADPISYQDYVVYCSNDGGATTIPLDYGQGGVMDVVFEAEPDDAIACDWFYVPPAGSDGGGDPPAGDGTVTVYATACPAGYDGDDYFADCYDNPIAGKEFAVSDAKSEFSVRDTTAADGFVTLPIPDVVSGGELALSQIPAGEVPGGADPPFVVYCTENGGEDIVPVRYSLVQLDPGGDAYYAALSVEPGDEVRCDWYLLTAGDQDDDDEDDNSGRVPVTRLPSTGAGSVAIDGDSSGAWIATALLMVLGMTGACRLVPRRAAV